MQRRGQIDAHILHERRGRRGVVVERLRCDGELELRQHEPLLSAVVEVALDLAPRRVGGRHGTGVRATQLVAVATKLGEHLVEAVRDPAEVVGGQERDRRRDVACAHAPGRRQQVFDGIERGPRDDEEDDAGDTDRRDRDEEGERESQPARRREICECTRRQRTEQGHDGQGRERLALQAQGARRGLEVTGRCAATSRSMGRSANSAPNVHSTPHASSVAIVDA